jgi:hypothetical protein
MRLPTEAGAHPKFKRRAALPPSAPIRLSKSVLIAMKRDIEEIPVITDCRWLYMNLNVKMITWPQLVASTPQPCTP